LTAELGAQRFGRGADERVDLHVRDLGGLDRGAPRGQQHRQRGPFRALAGRSVVFAGQCVTGGANRVDIVGLRTHAPWRPFRAVQLQDFLALHAKVAGEPGAVAAGPFDRPRPQPAVTIGELDELVVAITICRDRHDLDHRPRRRGDDRGGVGVFVRVDPDDEIDEFCEHGHCVPPLPEWTCGSGPGRRSAGL